MLPQNLRVAILVRSFSTKGGLELYTYKVVEGLLTRGLYITVFCEESSDELSHKNLTISKFTAPDNRATKSQKLHHYLKVTDQILNALGPFDLVHSQHFPTTKADVVTFHNQTVEQLNRVGFIWEQLFNRIKCLFVPAYRLRWQIDKLLYCNSSCSIFPAEVMHKDFVNTYKLPAQYVIAHPGASLSETINSISFEQPDECSFLFVGRGYRKKGLDVLLNACKILSKQNRKFKLIIAGLRAKTLDKLRLKFLGLENKVHYLGFQRDMASVYRQASVFVMPSKMEPFGMAAVQAMQFGLVPIVSKVSGVAEVLTDMKDALILQNQLNSSELAALMAQLMDNSNLRLQLSEQAKSTAQSISWEKTVQSTLSAYSLAMQIKSNERQSLNSL